MADKQKFPSEVVDLPSGGLVYSKDSPLSSGKIELKYMTAREEDILTSQNLIKKGVVIDSLLKSLIVTKNVSPDDLILGDKNAVMVAARVLAYGPEYTVEIENKYTGEKFDHTFNLTECQFKELRDGLDYSSGEFEVKLPASKSTVKFKFLTGKDESIISEELKKTSKFGNSTEITTRLRHIIVEVNGDREESTINPFVMNMLSRDSLFLRQEISKITPDIELTQEVEMEGELVEVDIPLTADFFWPSAV
jgi:hypothetical protein